MSKRITLYIDLDHANELRMDLLDLVYKPENAVKHSDENKDWHLLLADSIEDQLKVIKEKDCKGECDECTCGKEVTREIITNSIINDLSQLQEDSDEITRKIQESIPTHMSVPEFEKMNYTITTHNQ